MTILVGVKCTDGIVIGADSIATSAMGPNPLVQVQSNEKIQIVGNKCILACTGAVGLSQRARVVADQMWRDRGFSGTSLQSAARFTDAVIKDFANTHVQRHPQHGIGFGALMALASDNDATLVEFGTTDFQPELKQGNLFFVAMGSGQLLADPFLAFVSRVLWGNQPPDVAMGKMGVFWVLDHTIKYAPGGVGAPLKLGVLQKIGADWRATVIDDTQEQAQFIADLESRIKPADRLTGVASSAPPALKRPVN